MLRKAIRHLAARTGQRPKDMIVMNEFNDPFYIGSETQYIAAYWAKQLYLLLGTNQKIHIRRLHYFALTQPLHKKPNGQIYCNTKADWKFLCNATKFARYLEILPF